MKPLGQAAPAKAARDCDSWQCCGECQGGGSGEFYDTVRCSWEIVSRPEGWEEGTNCWLKKQGVCEIEFSATLEGSYTIKCTADDGGRYDECAEERVDDDEIEDTVSIGVEAWEAGSEPAIGINVEVWDETPNPPD
jgi:hypothetical protein